MPTGTPANILDKIKSKNFKIINQGEAPYGDLMSLALPSFLGPIANDPLERRRAQVVGLKQI